MSSSYPTIVVVPGAWHSPIHYKDLTTALVESGYPTISGTLPSLNPPVPENQTVSHDAEFIRNDLLRPLLGAGKDIVLAMHSYGGYVEFLCYNSFLLWILGPVITSQALEPEPIRKV